MDITVGKPFSQKFYIDGDSSVDQIMLEIQYITVTYHDKNHEVCAHYPVRIGEVGEVGDDLSNAIHGLNCFLTKIVSHIKKEAGDDKQKVLKEINQKLDSQNR